MKIFIIHGEHTLNSYNRLQEYIKKAREKDWEIQYAEKDDKNIREIFLGQSLFLKDRLLVIKDIQILSGVFLNWLKDNEKRIPGSLIIYHRGKISSRLIRSLPKTDKAEEFELPKFIWSFLDSFFPGNAKNAYKLLHEAIKTEPVEFVFAMLARQIRDIYWAKVDPSTMECPSWRVAKYKNLASKFKTETLEELIDEMSQADINSKTSHTDLTRSLDFIIAKYLE